ncbi:MAG: glycoside hydrolase family 2 [Oscillospiraceae bacterium]|nr:glycoside hydrolase family 2 [Oscillospiraceae bacterium]
MTQLLTRWGRELKSECPLNDYPRPQMERNSFICLNGQWDYAIYPKNSEFSGYEGKITVPFSPETVLSGVNRTVTPNDVLYYRKNFRFTKTNSRALLHFGAVDYACEVKLNGISLGSHTGGYFPFCFDATPAIISGENELTLTVTDPSETGSGASGKQTSKRGGIWYTPQSGIWQTVWIEEVPESFIESVKITPDIDNGLVNIKVNINGEKSEAKISVLDNGKIKAEGQTLGGEASVSLSDFQLWSPETPYLYDLVIKTDSDEVKSYFGMRKFGVGKDKKGVARLMLNNEPYFMNGLLDQGYWSDGMYTAPSDEALIYDIAVMKEMGFNMLRKHIKIEPLRWYYHCDRLGMLVWQDMINGGNEVNQLTAAVLPAFHLATNSRRLGNIKDTEKSYKLFSREDEKGREEYYIDAKRMIDSLYNCVSLCLWVPFNEGWGQFDALKAEKFFRENDPTRIIDHASGWHDQGGGDVNSFHIYFTPFFFPKRDKNDCRAIALTEFGGYSMKTEGHVYNTEKMFGYRKYSSREQLENALEKLYGRLEPLIERKGLSALVYTEVSDVEDETNGLLTYDREVVKVSIDLMKKINAKMRFKI